MNTDRNKSLDIQQLVAQIKFWAKELGFDKIGFCDTDIDNQRQHYLDWLAKDFQGDMDYLTKNIEKRLDPKKLVPDTKTIISVTMNYLTDSNAKDLLDHPNKAYISRYALGRDYHKVLRSRLNQLAKKISAEIGPFGYRAFTDSAPVLERPLAEKAGLGWTGKHTLILNRDSGSLFFLGELFTDLPLPIDQPVKPHCGNCTACIDICPTQAIIAPYKLDANRCISYLTIEYKGSIPLEFRPLIGNRIMGCDDCQLFCPWNRFAKLSTETDFQPRNTLDDIGLTTLFNWSETEFLKNTEGSAIRRVGYICWQRNIAVALGNAKTTPEIIQTLDSAKNHPEPLVREHVNWALEKHRGY